MKTNSLERLFPDDLVPDDVTGRETLMLHQERYRFAAEHLKAGRLLDIACGAGYGTALMVENARVKVKAVGVDLSGEAVDYARRHYGNAGLSFIQHDAMTYTDEERFDSIVSIETLEHVPDPIGLIRHLLGLLRPGGALIASVPTTPSVDANPYHLHDFTERSFRGMIAPYGLKESACLRQVQRYPLLRTLRREEIRMKDMRPNLSAYYLRHPRAFANRVWATLRFGCTNRYLTAVWHKPD